MTQTDEPDVKLWEANLQGIITCLPDLARLLEQHIPESKLVRNSDGEWDVEFRGEYLYGTAGYQRIQQSFEMIRTAGINRLHLSPISSQAIDAISGNFLYKLLHKATSSGFSFSEQPMNPESYHVVSFGFGLGQHMPELLEMSKAKSVCIVEPNIDFLYHSLFIYDWSPLLDLARNNDRRFLSVITATQANDIAQQVRHHLRVSCPIAVDGTIMFQTYYNPTMSAAVGEIRRDGHMISIGLGFLHDEMEMTRAAYKNLCDGNFRMFHASPIRHNVPAFIVGSGPSVDDDIEVIKKFQDRAVIFSCGTAGRVLLANGIQPDFELVLENGTNPYLALSGAQTEFGFEKATLIASNTVDPRMKGLFKDAVFFFRQALSSYALFNMGPEYNLENPGPTVANTGLSAALAMGFHQIYLFGIDLGTRKQGRHHSRHSVYRHDDDQKEGVLGAFDYADDYPLTEVGNFGGIVHSDLIMTWTRDALTTSIRPMGAAIQVFNCSDGILVPKTIPKSSSSIKLSTSVLEKEKAVTAAISTFPRGSAEEIHRRWTQDDWLERIRDLANEVIAVVDAKGWTTQDLMHDITKMMINDHLRIPTHAEFFIRGSILTMLMAADYYSKRVIQGDRIQEYLEILAETFTTTINDIVNQSAWFFENLDGFESYEDLEAQAKEWGNG